MKTAYIWGACPCRELELNIKHARGGVTKYLWRYICKKSRDTCDPNYCLGPDEDSKIEEKGGTDED